MERRMRRLEIMLWVSMGCWALMFAVMGYVIYRLARAEERAAEDLALVMEAFSAQGERLSEAEGRLMGAVSGGVETLERRINNTDYRIGRIDRIYGDLLAEQQKKTLDSLYTDIDLADKEKTAMALYREGRYAEAHELFTVVAREQPENQAARFYQYYTRFLMNRLNREAYGEIRSGLAQLERNGYSRAEFREVLDFIDQEEQGYAGE